MRVLVLYAGDLAARSVVSPGGINSNLRGYLGDLPAAWEVEVWGVGDRQEPDAWSTRELALGRRAVRVRPLVTAGPAAGRRVPLALSYCGALAREAAAGRVSRAGFDVVFAHRTEYLATLALAARSSALPPALAFIHGSSSWSVAHMGRLKGTGQVVGERLALPLARRVALVSESTLPYYRAKYPRFADRFVWVPNGVDVARFGAADGAAWRAANGFAPTDRVVLYVGRYDAEKGIARMLAAFRLLVERDGPDVPWRLACAGAGPLRPLVVEAGEGWGRGRIRELGHVGQDVVPSLVAAADVSLLVSDFEGLSNSMLESLAAGTPMVATPVGDNGVVLGHVDPALIADGFAPDDIANRLAWAWANREALAPKAHAAARYFSLDARVGRIVALAQEIVETERSEP